MSTTAVRVEVGEATHIFCTNHQEYGRTARSSYGIRKKEDQMLKIRLQGTPNDIKWFKKILERDKRIQVNDILSEPTKEKAILKRKIFYFNSFTATLFINNSNMSFICGERDSR